ncbi:HoxN/HupN/NixA family nickel/cobalt transporter [Kineococcus arenarius]|uniref:HoxN/HupN/NixA family nickel/cobalt transporter n=1 Tax=Kineococcus sp. SYSU DK007 TaxID=3383128 RepID=UPI003D7E27DF
MVAALHLIGWGGLALIVPAGYQVSGQVGGQVFGWALGLSAYAFGVRHAFDADHIAVIDGATRKLTADAANSTAGAATDITTGNTPGDVRRPLAVGFWFSLGHSSVVFAMALLVATGARFAATLVSEDSAIHHGLGLFGASAAGIFLWVIGLINLAGLLAVLRLRRRLRRRQLSPEQVHEAAQVGGAMARLLRPLTARIRSPRQAYGVGVLMGLGFDTATEVALLVLAGTAAITLPWYAVLILPVLFAAGMSLFDTLDGAAMTLAYDVAHREELNPLRKLTYNAVVTGLTVTVALAIGTLQLATAAHDGLRIAGGLTEWLAGLDTALVGVGTVVAFTLITATALLVQRPTTRRA